MTSPPTRLPHAAIPPGAAPERIAVLGQAVDALRANRFDLAATLSAPLVSRDPADIEAMLLLGLAAGATGHTEPAARLLHQAAQYRGEAAHPILDLVAILRRTGQFARIEPQFRALLRIAPTDVALLHGLGDFLYDDGRGEDALPLLAEALRLKPEFMAARNLVAIALADLGRTEAAISELRVAADHAPDQAGVWANLGLLLKDDGQFDEALAAYDIAVALAPDDAQIRVNRCVALLRAGQWAKAWPDYEWRLTLAGDAARRPRLLPSLSSLGEPPHEPVVLSGLARFPVQPGLLGLSEPPTRPGRPDLRGRSGLPDLPGLTVLAAHEDGYGDTLHFARYLPMLAARGVRVVAWVPPPLIRIMRTVPGVLSVHGTDEPPPEYDFHCPFFSLPRAFETTPDTIPAPLPYLHADPALVEAWRQLLPAGTLRVGLVWAGQARPSLPGFGTLDGRRSTALATFAPLAAVPEVVFVSLQHGPEAVQARAPPPGMNLFDPMPGVGDFADTAAIIANLDLVISVDTSVVHLAGGMGKPVFLLDRYDHCWRWLSGRSDSPWYPAMRIFRQKRIGDWGPVLRDATAALADLAAASGPVSEHR